MELIAKIRRARYQANPLITLIFLITWLITHSAFAALPIHIVAAENFYGELAKEIGGPYVQVTSIINNPNQDPHLFSVSTSVGKAIADADIIIYNGADYDPWIIPLLTNTSLSPSSIIIISQLLHTPAGANPHLWYNPKTMPIYAETLTHLLIQKDPAHENFYTHSLFQFQTHYKILLSTIEQLQKRYQGTPVSATEPVFNEMAHALGFIVKGEAFQIQIMNDTEPSPSQIKAFEEDIQQHHIKLLFYNNQVSNPLTKHMQTLCLQAGIPIVGVSETQPLNKDYISWMLNELNDINSALANNAKIPSDSMNKEPVH